MKNTLQVVLIVLLSFSMYFVLDDIYFKELRKWLYGLTDQFGISHILTYTISGIPLFLGMFLISPKTNFFGNFGLNKSIGKGFLFALICTLPMFIGFGILSDFQFKISIDTFLIAVVAAGFFEELFFRGFLFGPLFKFTKLGFIPAVFFGALYFGVLHLYQSNEVGELIGIFAITFLGGILFAWTYAEWNYNLWVPIFLHSLMNFSWELFSISDNALGGIYPNVFRIMTIGLIITLTILYKKKKGIKLEINKNTIWRKKEQVL